MKKVRQALIGVSVAISLAFAAAPATAAENQSAAETQESAAVNSIESQIQLTETTLEGFTAVIENGVFSQSEDGEINVYDEDGNEAGTFNSAMLMSDGSLNLVEYELNGDTVEARYSSPLQEEGPVPVVTQDWVTCGFATLATIAAIATVPVTGGWSVLGAGAAAGYSSYECAQAGQS
jgi:hypothetical protein